MFYFDCFGKDWELGGSLKNDSRFKELRKLHPEIKSASELSQLLKRITLIGPVDFLYAEEKQKKWKVIGRFSSVVNEILYETPTLYLRQTIGSISDNFIGSTESIRNRQTLEERLGAKLKVSGYPFSRIKIIPTKIESGIRYNIEVSEGLPCILEEVIYAVDLPEEFKADIPLGELCNLETISNEIRILEEKLQDESYSNARLELADLKVNPLTGYGKVLIKGSLGEKILYEIRDQTQKFSLQDFFSDEDVSLDPNFVSPDAMVSEISRSYRNNGYSDVKVDPPVKTYRKDGSVVYTYKVNSGQVFNISSITFDGVSILSTDEAIEVMGIKSFWKTNPILNLRDLRKGVDQLRSAYLSQGYWNVKVREPRITKNTREGSAQIVIVVDEGLPHVLGTSTIKGNKYLKFESIFEQNELYIDEPLSRDQILKVEDELKKAYLDQGYLYVTVEKEINRSIRRKHQSIDLTFIIKEGPRVQIGYIEIRGLRKTKRKVVTRELLFNSGDWYFPEKITETRRRLINTGVFAAVQITPVNNDAVLTDSQVVDLLIDVREKVPGQVSFGPGYQLRKGFQYVAEGSYANIGGLGRRISLRTALSEERNQKAIDNRTLVGRKFGVGFLEPNIGDTNLDMKVSVSHKAVATSYWDIGYTAETALVQEIPLEARKAELQYFYNLKLNREEGTPEQTRYILTQGGVRIGTFGARFFFDNRDFAGWPTSGTVLEAEARVARYLFGGNVRFLRWHANQTFYFGLARNWVLAATYDATAYADIDRKDVDPGFAVLPASERLFAGGPDLVRGYAERLGPFLLYEAIREENGTDTFVTQKEVIGGTHRLIMKLALRYRIDEGYGFFTFADLGNSYSSKLERDRFASRFNTNEGESTGRFKPSIEENFIYNFENVLSDPSKILSKNYLSYGAGFNLLTPFGTASIYYALPWKQPLSDRCSKDEKYCKDRRKKNELYFLRGEIGLNIGAKF